MSTDRVVAAIDFGTYGTGYAWAVVDPRIRHRSDRAIHDREDWPDAGAVPSPKTLTALLLRDEKVLAWGHTAARLRAELERHWHREDVRAVEAGLPLASERDRARHRYYYGMKMSLRRRDDPARDSGDRGPGLTDDLGDPTALISMYLAEVVRTALADVTRDGQYSASDVRWCLTVPAFWSEASMDRMRRAAVAAGLPDDPARLLLVPEPDAAALYCDVVGTTTAGKDDAGEPRPGLLRPGMRFLVLDCGGGTADLVSYRIGSDGSVEQLCRPSGGPFGAEYTTQGRDGFLRKALALRFGGAVDFEGLHLTHADQFAELAAAWERERDTFTVDRRHPITVTFPSRLYASLSEGALSWMAEEREKDVDVGDTIVLPAEEVRAILDSVVDPVLDQVDEQLARWDRPPDAEGAGDTAFLVGGFARSPYLRHRLEDRLQGRIPLRTAPRPERAVLFGAVHYCYEPTLLRARRARSTYGCECDLPIMDGDDPDLIYDDDEGVRRSRKRFLRFVAADEKVPVGREVCQRLYPTTAEQTTITFTFYSTEEHDGRYVTDAGMTLVGTMEVGLEGAMHLPRAERGVDVFMKFGEADIQVRAVNVTTGAAQRTTLGFDSVR
ncbi:Hsp70 family protein [Streptomyces lincolnensis]|uniref:Hsp70 family protein n=1 Tax=Streptomyces lincolnensis TaxID=1915 RepID=UPI0037D3F80B